MKQLKPFDYIIIAAVIAVILIGVLVYTGKNKFSSSPVETTKKIAFQVMLKGVSITDTQIPFKTGDESFITIRNVPYTKLQIIDVAYQPRKIVLPVNNAQQPFIVVDDFSQPYQYDFVITLKKKKKITDDGPVAGGNKIKIGTPIVLEGYNYRTGGTISNVQTLDDKDVFIINQQLKELKNAQNKEKETVQNNVSDKTKDENKTSDVKEDNNQKSAE